MTRLVAEALPRPQRLRPGTATKPMSARCGTEPGYRRHRAERTVPCRDCCDAHAVAMANWRARTRVTAPLDPRKYAAARLGHLPADALAPGDRTRLVAELHRLRWDDVRIATHTRMTTFTTARIRASLDLPPNPRSAPQWQPGITSSPNITGPAHS